MSVLCYDMAKKVLMLNSIALIVKMTEAMDVIAELHETPVWVNVHSI